LEKELITTPWKKQVDTVIVNLISFDEIKLKDRIIKPLVHLFSSQALKNRTFKVNI